jgi:hypothetical protein
VRQGVVRQFAVRCKLLDEREPLIDRTCSQFERLEMESESQNNCLIQSQSRFRTTPSDELLHPSLKARHSMVSIPMKTWRRKSSEALFQKYGLRNRVEASSGVDQLENLRKSVSV